MERKLKTKAFDIKELLNDKPFQKALEKAAGSSSEEDAQKNSKEFLFAVQAALTEARDYTPKVGIFGNTGVGKSSLCNALFGEEVAKVDDVEACTRYPQEIWIGKKEKGGIALVDVPGIGEDLERHKEYTRLYKKLVPELDLILWLIKADDRNFHSGLDVYSKVVSSIESREIPIVFVITQVDKTNPIEDWDRKKYEPGETQLKNIKIKEKAVAEKFSSTTDTVLSSLTEQSTIRFWRNVFPGLSNKRVSKNVISVATSQDGKSYNLMLLVERIVKALPAKKKFPVAREVKPEHVSKSAKEEVQQGFGEWLWEKTKEVAVKVGKAAVTAVVGWVKSWWPF